MVEESRHYRSIKKNFIRKTSSESVNTTETLSFTLSKMHIYLFLAWEGKNFHNPAQVTAAWSWLCYKESFLLKLSMIFLKNFKVLTWSFYHHHSHPFTENLHSDTSVGAAAHQIPTLREGLQVKLTSCALDLHTPQLAGNSFQTSVC